MNSALARDPFPGNIVPQARFSNVARNLLKYFPPLTNGNLSSNILASGTVARNIYQSNGRIDHSFNANQKLSGSFSQRYRRTDATRLNAPLPAPFSSSFSGDNQNTYFYRVVYDRIWKPNLVSQIRAGGSGLKRPAVSLAGP